jgi:hypothetical protein
MHSSHPVQQETWSLTPKDAVLENEVMLRVIFRLMKHEVTTKRRKLQAQSPGRTGMKKRTKEENF